jgi:HSP20 family protein
LQELEQVTERMRRMLDETFGRLGFGWPPPLREGGGWSPLVDVEEQDDAYVIDAELPGVKREDVEVELVGNEVAISGELKEEERTGVVRRRTRRIGRFDYRMSLPQQVDAEKVEATLADGVLTVRVPKAERAERKKIEVKASSAS